ncbi:hypothetical protein LCDV1gp045 [Lymphocystis disease virus 1]|uniref:hypothetical protein n=1 Tax=Fish lymphocystis disease virus TaxID=36363 RepID=UPI0000161ED5|nr:hypothetical protein LCDV1gp045 [Lymphocystis disease virus 1]
MEPSLEKFNFITACFPDTNSECITFQNYEEFKKFFKLQTIVTFVHNLKDHIENNRSFNFNFKNLTVFKHVANAFDQITKEDLLVLVNVAIEYFTDENMIEIFKNDTKCALFIKRLVHPVLRNIPLTLEFWVSATLDDVNKIFDAHMTQNLLSLQELFVETSITKDIEKIQACLTLIMQKHELLLDNLRFHKHAEDQQL